jgi:endonuclease I/V8-like Glu-specific endopeptidase
MPPRDFVSQIKVPGTRARFKESAPERELVKRQIRAGKSPLEIELDNRVEMRIENLGFADTEARTLAREVRASGGRFEAAAAARGRRPGLERIIGDDDLLSSAFLARGARAAECVCCILEGEVRIGTGFLVAPRLLMTNAHVVLSQENAVRCRAEFDFEDAIDHPGTEGSVVFRLLPEEFFVISPEEELDYALVAVEATSVNEKEKKKLQDYGFLPLNPTVGNALRGECLNIIQHPNGAPKRIALRQNRFTALLDRYVHYETDTMPGSSGSPVFNDQWEVVCLHHSGVPLVDSQGRYLTKDNRVWREDEDPALIQWIGNEGVRISRIVADVDRQVGANRPKLLSRFPLPGEMPPNEEEKLVDGAPQPSGVPKPRPNPQPPRNDNGGALRPDQVAARPTRTVTIPLTVTVSLEEEQGPVSLAVSSPAGVPASPAASEPEGLVERGLANLERARTRTYYDAAQDRRDRDSYYADIDVAAPALAKRLRELVTDTHTTQLSYRVARIEHLYAWVDLQRDKMVRSIYSDERFDPRNFIREDFTIERRLESIVARRRAREANLTEAAVERLLAALEAQEPFNCEHVVPQSWFGNDAPMQGDLHHLFACQHQCNSFRSNQPYHDFNKFAIGREGLRPRCGFAEDGRFEPFMGKGKVARATLYFLLRYAEQFDDRYEDDPDAIAMLLDWHTRAEVTEHEQHRNQAIFELQGNRNPFIDHAEWAQVVFT